MKTKKAFIGLLIILAMIFAISSCGGSLSDLLTPGGIVDGDNDNDSEQVPSGNTGGGGGGGRGGGGGSTAPTITTTALPGGVALTAYSQTLTAAGTAPITWSIDSGSLPVGLKLNASSGVISGTPTVKGTSSFTVKAANSAGSNTKALSIVITAVATGTPDTSWYGAGDDFTLINADDLAGLAQLVTAGNDFSGKTITLSANMDLSVYADWEPIGFYSPLPSKPFSGIFDGGGKIIASLTIISGVSSRALFGCIGAGGVVKNLKLEDVDINTSGGYVGGVVGWNYGTVSNCSSEGSVKGNSMIGGIAGVNAGNVENCYFEGNVDGNGTEVGGVVGTNYYGTVKNCYSTGSFTDSSGGVGGVVGYNEGGDVKNCYSTGSVEALASVGGVVGGGFGTIENCYSTGVVIGNIEVGGVAGAFSGTVENCVALNPSITKSTGLDTDFGRVVGWILGSTFINNHAWVGMQFIDGTPPGTATFPGHAATLTGKDGADLTAPKTQAAWTTAGFTFGGASPWVWNGTANMPSLSGVGTAQDWPGHL